MKNRPPLNGLVLAGGFSRRFGIDKAGVRLQPEGRVAVEVMWRKLRAVCDGVWVSLRPDQNLPPVAIEKMPILRDEGASIGPLGGLQAAFTFDSEAAWLVVACDMFALDDGTIRRLVAARHPAASIIAARDPERRRPEPLCAIYEPACALAIERQRASGNFRLCALCATLPLAWVSPTRPDALSNFNHRETLPRGLVVGMD